MGARGWDWITGWMDYLLTTGWKGRKERKERWRKHVAVALGFRVLGFLGSRGRDLVLGAGFWIACRAFF